MVSFNSNVFFINLLTVTVFTQIKFQGRRMTIKYLLFPRDIEMLGLCPLGPVLPPEEKVPL